MVATSGTADAAKKLAARGKQIPPVVEPAVGTNANVTLDPNSAAYQEQIKIGQTPEQIQANYANVMKTSEVVDQSKFNQAVEPQKVESLASVDTKINQPAPQKTEVAQSSADTKNTAILDPNKDDSPERLAQVTANLKNFEATTPDIFNNKAEYDKVVGRANKSPIQQQIVDSYFNSVKTTREKVAAVDKAKVELSSMSDSVLGYLNPTPEQLSIINNDQELLARYKAATQQRSILDSIQAGFTKVEVPVIDGFDNIGGNLTQEITALNGTLVEEVAKYNEIQSRLDTVDTDVKNEYAGQNVTSGFIQAMINKRKSDITKELSKQKAVYDTVTAKVGVLKDQATTIQAEKKAKEEEFTSKLNALNVIMGIQNTQEETDIKKQLANQKAEDPNIGKTTEIYNSKGKKVGVMQWNTETQRYDIPVLGSTGDGSTGGGLVGGSGVDGTTNTGDFELRFARLLKSVNDNKFAPLSTILLTPDNQADLAYIQNTLARTQFKDAKKLGVSFGQMTNPEWEMLRKTASSINPLSTKGYTVSEIYRLAPGLKDIDVSKLDLLPGSTQQKPKNVVVNTTLNDLIKKNGGTPTENNTTVTVDTKDKSFIEKVGEFFSNLR